MIKLKGTGATYINPLEVLDMDVKNKTLSIRYKNSEYKEVIYDTEEEATDAAADLVRHIGAWTVLPPR